MNRIGLLADVHGNLVALRAVIERLRADGATSWICAGDLVGYGAAPDECVEEVLALPDITVVAGNHDLMALGRIDAERLSEGVRLSTRWTAARIGAATRAALEALPLRATTADGVVVAHGSLDDPEEYVRAPQQAERIRAQAPGAPAVVLGHTHLPLVHGTAPVVVNPGGVGQSRERALHARGALLDPGPWSVEHVVVDYDVPSARAAQRAAGLPEAFLHLRPPSLPARLVLRLVRGGGR